MNVGNPESNEKVHAAITFHGRVQQVGFRKKVKNIAEYLEIYGFVENLKDPTKEDKRYQPVRALCIGSRSVIERFIELMSLKNGYIDVEDVEVTYLKDFDLNFYDFTIFRDGAVEEVGSRMDRAIEILSEMKDEIKTGNRELKEEISSVNDEIKTGNRELKEEMSSVKDEITCVKEGITSVKDEITSVNEGISNLGDEISSFHNDSNERFDRLDGKYHVVSQDLKGIRRAVEKNLSINEGRAEYAVDGKPRPKRMDEKGGE